jgi:flagellar hook protein FlgE
MLDAFNIALSGLQAAQQRLANSANNIANSNSTGRVENDVRVSSPFQPQRVVQQSQPEGGVSTSLQPVTPAYFLAPSIQGGEIIEVPNVSLDSELIEQKMATYNFKAQLQVIKAEDENTQSLLNIIS